MADLGDHCPSYPVVETVAFPVVINSYPESLSVRRILGGPHEVGGYDLEWVHLPKTDFTGLETFYTEQAGGAQVFTWTPPNEDDSSLFRIRPNSFLATMITPNSWHVRMSVDKVAV